MISTICDVCSCLLGKQPLARLFQRLCKLTAPEFENLLHPVFQEAKPDDKQYSKMHRMSWL